ncbi:MAG: Cof-type HAD-IIB family hydrolase [Halanaerobiales bacterium]
MNYKLLALDLDGTLLNEKSKLTQTSIEIINKIKQQGVKVIIATGRMLISALPYVKKLNLKGPVITYNGAYVKDISTEKVLYHKPVCEKLAVEIIRECKDKDLHLNFYLDDKLYVEEDNYLSRGYERSSGVTAHKVSSFEKFRGKDPTKLLIIEEDREKHQYLLKYFIDKYSKSLEIAESKSNYIEFMAKGVSKGKALKYITEKYSLKPKEVIAIGDSWNDLSMLSWAGVGIAMGNASDDIKKQADMVALSRKQDGVTRILTKIF